MLSDPAFFFGTEPENLRKGHIAINLSPKGGTYSRPAQRRRAAPATPTRPVPSRSIVAGSGIGAEISAEILVIPPVAFGSKNTVLPFDTLAIW